MQTMPSDDAHTHTHARRSALTWLGVGIVAAASPALAQNQTGRQMSVVQALTDSQDSKLTLIDVRTPDEWKQTGVPKGAGRITMQHPGGEEGFAAELLKKIKGDKHAPVALICRSGNRSSQVQRWLEKRGFTHIYNVSEGMVGRNGWLARGLPLE